MKSLLKSIFVSFSVLSVVAWSGGGMALANEAMSTENAQNDKKIVADEVVKETPGLTSSVPELPVVHGEWCSALMGMISSSGFQNNEVVDVYPLINNDGVVDLSDISTVTRWYDSGNNTACRARFDDTFTQNNYLDIDWCAGLVKGVGDSINTKRGNANFSEIFNVFKTGDSTDVIDMSDLVQAQEYTDQAICYAHYGFGDWPSEEPVEPVAPSDWCIILKGVVTDVMNDQPYGSVAPYSPVADLNNDSYVNLRDLAIMNEWYDNGNVDACRAQFFNGGAGQFYYTPANYTERNWCDIYWKGFTDSYNSRADRPEDVMRYSYLFDLVNNDDSNNAIDLSDLVLATQAVGTNNQAVCYDLFAPPFPVLTCPVLEHASAYNPFPTCGATSCESGYHLDNASCVVDQQNPTPSSGGTSGGGGGISLFNIFNVQNSVLTNSANITWQTNRNSLTWMLYGTSTSYGSEYQGANYHTAHTLDLTSLSPATLYHYQIRAKDISNNTVYDIDRTFTTPGGLPPQVLGVKEEACKVDVDGDINGVMQFISGSLVRGCGPEVYHVLGNEIYHVPNWQYLHDNYFAQRIYNVSPEVIDQYSHTIFDNKSIRGNGAKVSGAKLYADGTLLKAKNGKIYVIVNGKKVHIASLEDLKKYSGNKMYNVSDDVLNQY